MGKITYSDKDKTGVAPINQFRDIDANEIKTVVNGIDDDKVDKVTGSSLVADTEIAKIHTHVWGSMYSDDSTRTVVITVVETAYPLAGGLSDGGSSGVTFQNSKELKCLTAGVYKIDWSATIKSTTDFTLEGFIIVNGLETSNTSNAVRTKENGTEYSLSGIGILTLAPNDLVGLAFESEAGTGTITVTHTSLVLLKIG